MALSGCRCFKKIKTYRRNLQDRLVIGEWVLIALEGYIEFLIAGYINILYPLKNKSGEIAGHFTAYYSIAVAGIVLPLLMIFVLTRPIATIQDEVFRGYFGSLYDGMRVKTKLQVSANLVFMLRRAFFLLICFNLEHMPGVQMVLVNLLNLIVGIYYGGV